MRDSQAAADPTLPATMLLSEGELQSLVSEGTLLGMGSAGKAFRTRYKGADAVVKVAHSRKRARLFEGEVRTLLALKGLGGAPRVLAVCENYLGFLMEFCPGRTLKDMLEEKASVSTILRGIYNLALRLQDIHLAGFAHNDIKPDNVILQTSGLEVTARIIDLGLSTRLGLRPGFQGDPEFFRHMAPELLQRGMTSVESDLYSIGNILRSVMERYPESFSEGCQLSFLVWNMTSSIPGSRPPFEMFLDVLANNLDVCG
ncbi:calcium-dependent protein kinase 2-like [Penaeus chinensis]|uniref:calcium-dependent protein kinase 2-like n=1 Tax=Penaeus chinensis TaxID=139456 RepID=UPI001FB57898|nr:calcium-dependent protein kinase 2-like [Penaeus chinensis]XP_047469406.1 calcium-dependent protein kinase 2-like [Penaeus chinensis]